MIASLILLAGCGAEAGSGQPGRDQLTVLPPGAAGATADEPPTDICATVRLSGPDGVCSEGPLAACDPDCTEVPPTDLCSHVFIIPDGTCDENGPLAACDPDCSKDEPEGSAGAPCGTDTDVPPGPVPSDDECSGVFVLSDGVCHTEEPCDPDCIQK